MLNKKYFLILKHLGLKLSEEKNMPKASKSDRTLKPKHFKVYKGSLVIRHKPTKVEYTIEKVLLDKKGSPVIICFRNYLKRLQNGEVKEKKIRQIIKKNDFKNYIRV
jgi:hypothetical protein